MKYRILKYKIAIIAGLILVTAVSFSAQSKVVTNESLETYRQQRLKAEREYRESYEKLGLPSPDELEKRREQSRLETEELSAKLRAENLERERIAAEREAFARTNFHIYPTGQANGRTQRNQTTYLWSYNRRQILPVRRNAYQQPGYFAGGQFWPTGGRTKSQPLIKIRNR